MPVSRLGGYNTLDFASQNRVPRGKPLWIPRRLMPPNINNATPISAWHCLCWQPRSGSDFVYALLLFPNPHPSLRLLGASPKPSHRPQIGFSVKPLSRLLRLPSAVYILPLSGQRSGGISPAAPLPPSGDFSYIFVRHIIFVCRCFGTLPSLPFGKLALPLRALEVFAHCRVQTPGQRFKSVIRRHKSFVLQSVGLPPKIFHGRLSRTTVPDNSPAQLLYQIF